MWNYLFIHQKKCPWGWMLFDFDLFWVRFTGVVAIQHNFFRLSLFCHESLQIFFFKNIFYISSRIIIIGAQKGFDLGLDLAYKQMPNPISLLHKSKM